MIAEADAVLISTPEFNWSMSGVLKNALEWLSRVDKPIAGKPVIPMGVSQGVLERQEHNCTYAKFYRVFKQLQCPQQEMKSL